MMGVLAAIQRALAPGYGCCLRCERPWRFVKEHATDYKPGSACFPLCERCWNTLATPEARLPYYHDLWAQWLLAAKREGRSTLEYHDDWQRIEDAVRLGG